jgi:stalled ribosome rescue protein Dom34
MKPTKQLGIWMDHSIAHLMELTNDTIVTNSVASKPKIQEEEQKLYKAESHVLNKEQNIRSAYFKKLSDVIKDYEEVILFGPTEAKNELLNLLKENRQFDKIKIDVKPADKMTEIQRNVFVKTYFNPSR